jgi:hypothetical protein
MRKKCNICNKLSTNWQKVNGSIAHCFDGCYSTTGRDKRTIDGQPAWLPYENKEAWATSRMWDSYRQ